jgi:hypothetical protein
VREVSRHFGAILDIDPLRFVDEDAHQATPRRLVPIDQLVAQGGHRALQYLAQIHAYLRLVATQSRRPQKPKKQKKMGCRAHFLSLPLM